MITENTTQALEFLGYRIVSDFVLSNNDKTGVIALQWLSESAQPSQAEIDAAIIPAQRKHLRAAISAERDKRKEAQGYTAAGKRFHSDSFSRIQQLGLVILGANMPAGIMWKSMDGSFIEMTPTLAGQIFGAAAAFDTALFAYGESLKVAVDAAADPTTVDIVAGWPG